MIMMIFIIIDNDDNHNKFISKIHDSSNICFAIFVHSVLSFG